MIFGGLFLATVGLIFVGFTVNKRLISSSEQTNSDNNVIPQFVPRIPSDSFMHQEEKYDKRTRRQVLENSPENNTFYTDEVMNGILMNEVKSGESNGLQYEIYLELAGNNTSLDDTKHNSKIYKKLLSWV